MTHFIGYLLHYVIARVIFDTLRGFGAQEWLLAGAAIAALILVHLFGRRCGYTYRKRTRRPRRGDAYRLAYERERARIDARNPQDQP